MDLFHVHGHDATDFICRLFCNPKSDVNSFFMKQGNKFSSTIIKALQNISFKYCYYSFSFKIKSKSWLLRFFTNFPK